ncbi:hypothetical protein ACWGJ9_10070 [Curtobacterium citreum]
MSRTRKDRPYRVVLNNPKHWRGEDHSWWQHHRAECDIDQQARPGGRGLPRCRHDIAWSVAKQFERHRCNRSREDRRYGWFKPERNHTRTVLGRARGDWNTTGTIDEDDIPVRQPRRGPWVGGYWC